MPVPDQLEVKRALISVTDKRGIKEFARGLDQLGVEIISTGGTAAEIKDTGIAVRDIADYTGFPEMLDGRVKTLHPKLYAGLLAVRGNKEHQKTLKEHGIEPIDLICVNLYKFAEAAADSSGNDTTVIEQIDIGGPTLIRAAAKNHHYVAAVVTPESYDAVLEELSENEGKLSLPTREALAVEAFSLTASYDAAISTWFSEKENDYPQLFVRAYDKVIDLSYGENPHQRAAFYADSNTRTHLLSHVAKLQGKPLSFNNILDLNAARELIDEFDRPAAVIIKHNNPCGAAVADDLETAYEKALACDPLSAFGGVICLNRPVSRALAEKLTQNFVELLFAPEFEDGGADLFQKKENMRILRDDERRSQPLEVDRDMRRVSGGMLVQDQDFRTSPIDEMKVVTEAKPSDEQWQDLKFALSVCKNVKSNAIVLAKDTATVGIGAGQMSRIDSVELAVKKAQSTLDGAVMASDAFFPFADGVDAAIAAGVTAIIQPGGSVRDEEIVAACNKRDIAMVFTGRRHFKH